MKICLIDTVDRRSGRFMPHWTPLGLAYVAASLERAGHQVRIIERDVLFRKNGLNLLRTDRLTLQNLTRFRPDLAGISSPTELFPDAHRTARIVKAACPDAPVVYGGHHATAVPLEILDACPEIDLVAVGEGETTLVELASGRELPQVRGIAFREGQRPVLNAPRPVVDDLDHLPMPARHLLDMDYRTRPSPHMIRSLTLRAATLSTSRGCPFRCSFCVESLPFGRKHRVHSVARVLAEMDHLLSRYRIEALYFLDEGFLSHENRVAALCEEMIRAGYHRRLTWAAQVRVDALNPSILGLMKEAGCIQLECGFETASDRLLQEVQKGTSHGKNREIIRMIRSSGIRVLANIMVGLPGETEAEFRGTVRFIQGSGVDQVVFSRFSPHPGSVLYQELLARGEIEPGFWARGGNAYESMNFTGMSDARFMALYGEAFEAVTQPLNRRDWMAHTSFRRRVASVSIQEVLYTLRQNPLAIPRALRAWLGFRPAIVPEGEGCV